MLGMHRPLLTKVISRIKSFQNKFIPDRGHVIPDNLNDTVEVQIKRKQRRAYI